MDIHLANALWTLDLLAPEDLPDVALKALDKGMDSPATRALASLVGNEVDEGPAIFESALKELGVPTMNRKEAAREYAIAVSKMILFGELTPQDGANRLWEASIRVQDPDFHDLDTFVYSASELQSRPEDSDFFNLEILNEARVWALK
jgi:hypothetical protein